MFTISRFAESTKPAWMWLLAAFLISILATETGFASKGQQNPDRARLLVLDKCDSDNDQAIPPQGDALLLLNSRCELVKQIPMLTIIRGFGGCRRISSSQDGRLFVVCSGEGITMYRTSDGAKFWSLSGIFGSAVFGDALIYALGPGGIYAIDREGNIVDHSRVGGGVDIVFDSFGKSLWVVGMNIRKYDLDLRLLFKVELPFSTLNSGAFSVDLNPDGSVWIAGRNAYEREGDGNQLVKISPEGKLLRVIKLDFCPYIVRVDRADGSVWTTGRIRRQDYSRIGDDWPETVTELDKLVELPVQSYTRKYDAEGRLLVNSVLGGTSIEVDPSDGSVWIAGNKSILHYSSAGDNLSAYNGIIADKKWLAIIP